MKITLAICAVLMAASASAQTTNCHYVPGGMNCTTQDPHEYDYLRQPSQQAANQAGIALGGIINSAVARPRVQIVWVTQHAGKIKGITVCYTNNKCGDPLVVPDDISENEYEGDA